MATLTTAIAAAAALAAAPAQPDPVARWRPFVDEAATRFGLPTPWIERVIRAESGGQTMLRGRPIRSSAGAMGLMQLMPGTWQAMRARLRLGVDPDDPRDNILAGSAYLRMMLDRFGYPGLFAAYNLGPAGYARFLDGKRSLPRETSGYLAKVAVEMPAAVTVAVPPQLAPLFTFRAGEHVEEVPRHLPHPLFVAGADAH